MEEAFTSEFADLDIGLSDDRYGELTAFEIQPLMQVDDFAHDRHGTGVLADDGSVVLECRGGVCGLSSSRPGQAGEGCGESD